MSDIETGPGLPAESPTDLAIDVDALFQAEDPDFAASMVAIHADADLQIRDGSTADVDANAPGRNWAQVRLDLSSTVRRLAANGLELVRSRSLSGLKMAGSLAVRTLARALSLPLSSKLVLLAVAILVVVCAALLTALIEGRRLPGYASPLLASFADVADHRYAFNPGDAMEEFNNPVRAAEHVVLLEKAVVNLRRAAPGEGTPMGLFEFYAEATSRDAAIELGNRPTEVADVVQRTIETMTYAELSNKEGKEKLKLLLRRNLNALLTKGRVHRVFYKTIVLKD